MPQTSRESTESAAAPDRPLGRRFKLRRVVFIGLLIPTILAIVLFVAREPLLVGFAYRFRVDNPAPSDAIVILLGGTPHRPERAAELYRQGYAPLILLCREKTDPVYHQDVSKLIKDYLVTLGVPSNAVRILPEEVGSTKDEADRVAVYLEKHPAKRITVVTTAFHTARALWIFRKVLRGRDLDIRAASAKDPGFDETDWYQSEEGLIFYFNELIKTVYYRLKY